MKDGRAEGDKVAKKLQELEQLMQAYGATTLDGEGLDNSISQRIEKCVELKELLDQAHNASQGKTE
jgi:hypothetical protein